MNPYRLPLTPSTRLVIGQYVLGGGEKTRALSIVDGIESNLPHSILQVTKLNRSSIGLVDTRTGDYYRLSRKEWDSDKPVGLRTISDEIFHKLNKYRGVETK